MRRGAPDIRGDRELGRHGPPDGRRGPFREEGPIRHRSRSPPFARDNDPRGPDRSKNTTVVIGLLIFGGSDYDKSWECLLYVLFVSYTVCT